MPTAMEPTSNNNSSSSSKSSDIDAALHALSTKTSDTATVSFLANASREDAEVRKRLANPGTLHGLVDVINSSISRSTDSLDPALRCLGNACADNNEARDTVTSIGFDWALQVMDASDKATQALATKVLYNICSEHEDSQKALYAIKLHYRLIRFLAAGIAGEECAVDLLFCRITGHKVALEPKLEAGMPFDILELLLKLPTAHSADEDVDTFSTLVEITLPFLRDEVVQKQVTSRMALFDDVRNILVKANTKSRSVSQAEDSNADDLKVLQGLETSITWVLSDCAAVAEGDAAIELCVSRCLHFSNLIRHESEDESTVLLAASCQELGNLIRNVDSQNWSHIVEKERLDTWLYRKVLRANQGPDQAMLLHSIAGLLIQLTRASGDVCEMMADSNDPALPALELLCRHSVSQVRDAGVRLLKRLGTASSNQSRLGPLGTEVMDRLKQESQDAEKADPEST